MRHSSSSNVRTVPGHASKPPPTTGRPPTARHHAAQHPTSGDQNMPRLRIQRIPLAKINPAPYNPRKDLKPGDPEYERLSKSLGEFGLVEPLVWNKRTAHLVGGHQRFKVLKANGIRDVEVSIV